MKHLAVIWLAVSIRTLMGILTVLVPVAAGNAAGAEASERLAELFLVVKY